MKCPYCGEEFSDTVAENHINNKWCLINKEKAPKEAETLEAETTSENAEPEKKSKKNKSQK